MDTIRLYELYTEEICTRYLGHKLHFKSKDKESLWAYPVLINFRELFKYGDASAKDSQSGVIPGISNQELLHAVVGLIRVCLPGLTVNGTYHFVCRRNSYAIILVRDLEDTIQHFTEEKTTQGEQEKVDDDDDDEDIDPEKDVLTKEDSTKRPSIFKDVFSDVPCYDEYSSEDEEEEEDLKMPDCTEKEPNFTGGVHTFIQNCRRRHRQQERCEGVPIQAEDVGVEDRLMGCAVFEEKWMRHYDMTYISFLAVRPQARNYQMGQYLISQCLDSSVVGDHDYVVTHAASGVDKFFRKFGFTDDKEVNSQWSDMSDEFSDCTMMTYDPDLQLKGTQYGAEDRVCTSPWASKDAWTQTMSFRTSKDTSTQTISFNTSKDALTQTIQYLKGRLDTKSFNTPKDTSMQTISLNTSKDTSTQTSFNTPKDTSMQTISLDTSKNASTQTISLNTSKDASTQTTIQYLKGRLNTDLIQHPKGHLNADYLIQHLKERLNADHLIQHPKGRLNTDHLIQHLKGCLNTDHNSIPQRTSQHRPHSTPQRTSQRRPQFNTSKDASMQTIIQYYKGRLNADHNSIPQRTPQRRPQFNTSKDALMQTISLNTSKDASTDHVIQVSVKLFKYLTMGFKGRLDTDHVIPYLKGHLNADHLIHYLKGCLNADHLI
ncbi:hypothetical protein ACOMHN_025999 [Nucella lapillus]